MLITFSCNNNEDVTPVEDPLVGVWKFHKTIYTDHDSGEITNNEINCKMKSYIEVKEDLTFDGVMYLYENQECKEYPGFSGFAIKNNDGTYGFSHNARIFTLIDDQTLKIWEFKNYYDLYKKLD